MESSSINSDFQFNSYKVDTIDFKVTPDVNVLASQNHSDCDIGFQLGLRNVLKLIKKDKINYISGLSIVIEIAQKETKKLLATGTFAISGLFSVNGTLSPEVEDRLAKIQAPAILLPYLRPVVSMTISSAGFSTIVLPLINMNVAAESSNIQIEERNIE